MSWNYRIIDHRSHLALHEVYYDLSGRVTRWSAEPTTFVGDSSDGAARLAGSLARALSDALNRPLLTPADLPDG